ncbi:reverse transcriptase domain-containing protein [Caerostris darwini]|uniref:Reverse transcriptase domain-containing protein n=1 Tax=Caerostris darwini TaxID=1538125 RepID=A0AAV4MXQ0_9ARAC|nr:reverse transcriptase domain-containing protein [Caerostris darwini]
MNKDIKELDHPSHFRPICILPCWGKVLDKIISDRLSYHLETHNILNNRQFGLRKNKSTILDFHKTSRNNNITMLISIDMFNAVDWAKMKIKIFALHIPQYLRAIVCHFLHDRKVVLQGTSKSYDKGIPQGSSLGPILWNIFINDLLNINFGTSFLLLLKRQHRTIAFDRVLEQK